LVVFLCGLSLEGLLLNDALDQLLNFAIFAVLGEFPLLCHAHSLPQTGQVDHRRGQSVRWRTRNGISGRTTKSVPVTLV
jgi:hypothetical protein